MTTRTTSTATGPLCIGITDDTCGRCHSDSNPLYDLPCHDRDAFYCRNCITEAWYKAPNETVPCPLLHCHKKCEFKDLLPLADILRNESFNQEDVDKVRLQPEVMNNSIAFTSKEADIALQYVYMRQHQKTEVHIETPGHRAMIPALALGVEFMFDPLAGDLLSHLMQVPKMMTSPYELQEDLVEVLMHLLAQTALKNHTFQLLTLGVDVLDERAVVEGALKISEPLVRVKENWEELIKQWVHLLAWRHMQRLEPRQV